MLVWSTHIPVIPSKSIKDLEDICRTWIVGSPHFKWTQALVPKSEMGHVVSVPHDGQTISVGRVTSTQGDHFGFRHEWRDADRRDWITEIVGFHCGDMFLIGVHLHCQTTAPGIRVPTPKKPYVVRQILDDLGGDIDGEFHVSDQPRMLGECEVDVAKRVLTGETHHHLPVIYVSSTWQNRPALDAVQLARWASGMAHVVVEPSRSFSFALANQVDKQNPYEGAVSINWPDGGGPPSRFFPYRFQDSTRFSSAIANIVRKALAGQRLDRRVTWDLLRELILRERVERLRAKGTASVDEYIEAFDEELRLTKNRASGLEEENGRLKRELAVYQNQKTYHGGRGEGLLEATEERELFPGEMTDILVRALRRASDNAQPDGRIHDVLTVLLKKNHETGESDRIEQAIRSALSSSNQLGKNERRALEEVGFSISAEGKHYKLVFRGDDRYTFSMPRSGSDWRGMKNWVSDTIKRLFK